VDPADQGIPRWQLAVALDRNPDPTARMGLSDPATDTISQAGRSFLAAPRSRLTPQEALGQEALLSK
jgi:hypothetical protein